MDKPFTFFSLVLLVLVIIGTGCVDESKKVWKGTVYPGGVGVPNMKFELGNYKTLEQCRVTAKLKLKAMRIESSGEYQCRKNCKVDKYGVEECEETVR
jgi:hypothetical protein